MSFAVEDGEGARRFWDEWGFVIFHGVLSADECEATVAEIWSTLEADHIGLSRSDASTHDLLPTDRYGLAKEQAMFTPQLVRNRMSPRLYACLDAICPPWPGHCRGEVVDPADPSLAAASAAGASSSAAGMPMPGANSIIVSQDRW